MKQECSGPIPSVQSDVRKVPAPGARLRRMPQREVLSNNSAQAARAILCLRPGLGDSSSVIYRTGVQSTVGGAAWVSAVWSEGARSKSNRSSSESAA